MNFAKLLTGNPERRAVDFNLPHFFSSTDGVGDHSVSVSKERKTQRQAAKRRAAPCSRIRYFLFSSRFYSSVAL